jgi:hypothetical protein
MGISQRYFAPELSQASCVIGTTIINLPTVNAGQIVPE